MITFMVLLSVAFTANTAALPAAHGHGHGHAYGHYGHGYGHLGHGYGHFYGYHGKRESSDSQTRRKRSPQEGDHTEHLANDGTHCVPGEYTMSLEDQKERSTTRTDDRRLDTLLMMVLLL
eukprot:TRINITY_DN36502_c0_g1_i1.p1 TRINITY_DN36502_c0_g1~~TRINITY_DN36502_c0_g1_i1.p1  ORF type:complete len:120 (+),score=15.64 TRINITY_DN36502_c0_g1_i1:117-476(+)